MTPLQTELFADQGYLRLQGFHPERRIAPIRQQLLDELKRISSNARGWSSLRTLPMFQQIGKLSADAKVRGLHETLMNAELVELVGRLAGRSPANVQPTQLLLSPPQQGTWSLQGLNWHVDVRAGATDPVPGIQAFFLIDDVAPRGGATLALAGSHRLGTHGMPSAASLHAVLKRQQDLAQELQSEGIALVEMCGRAGDVFLMDMRVLHTPSINATRHPRMMATCRCLIGIERLQSHRAGPPHDQSGGSLLSMRWAGAHPKRSPPNHPGKHRGKANA